MLRRYVFTSLWLAALAGPLLAQQTSQTTVRRARNWSEFASEGWCAIKVWVDDEAEFALEGERLLIFTAKGQAARDVASECSAPLPRNVESFRFKGIDGRGEVRLLEEPTARNRWRAVVRIRDTKGGGEEYHYRLEWGRGSAFSSGRGSGRGSGSGSGGSGGTFFDGTTNGQDLTRMKTRDLRREIDRIYYDVVRRRPSSDDIDDYIDRVRFDRWTSADIARDAERRR